jgi:class 3 adenylate cyclase
MTGLQPGAATMTVLFTDLVGSTAMRSTLGDDRADLVQREHDDLLARIIDDHRGTVVKGLGDGIMAVFQAPSEGVAAAVAIQQAITRRNRRADVELALRMGLSVGEVRVEGDDVFGTPVVEASRLQAKAADDQILASVYVKALAGSRSPVGFDEVGPLALKGLTDELLTYEVRWWEAGSARPVPFPTISGYAEPLPFAGRNLERFALVDAWSRARAGRGPVVFVEGDAGVGKTRFAVQFARSSHNDGALVLYGRCRADVAQAYEPFVDALRAHVANLSDAQLAEQLGATAGELVRLVPELAGRVVRHPTTDVGPEAEALRMYDAVAHWLAAASRAEPIVFVIDDLQWAGASTLALLRHVLLTTDPMRVLVLATYQDGDLHEGHPLPTLVNELQQSPRGVEHLHLDGLDPRDFGQLLASAAADGDAEETVDADVERALFDITGGNPLHLEHALHLLRDEGRPLEDARLTVPPTVAGTIAQRLALLDDGARTLVRIAAVLGQEFDLPVIRSLLGVDDATLQDATKAALDALFLTDLPDTNVVVGFSHALVREAVNEASPIDWRVSVHRQAAEEIERQAGTGHDRYVLELAHHFVEAAADGDASRGIDYAVSAARRFSDQLAFPDARRWYRTALRLLEAADGRDGARRLDLLVALGHTEAQSGRASARQTLTRAATLAQRLGDTAALLQAVQAYRVEPMFPPPPGGETWIAILRDALMAVAPGDDPTLTHLSASLAFERSFAAEPDDLEIAELADWALELARQSTDRRLVVEVLQLRIPTIDGPHALDERRALSEELYDLGLQLDEPLVQFRAVHFLVQCGFEQGDIVEADRWIQLGRALLRQLRLPVSSYVLAEDDALRALLVGDLDEAERAGEHWHEMATVVGRTDRPEQLAFWFALRHQQGRAGDLADLATQLLAYGETWMGATPLVALVDAGRLEDARELYQALPPDVIESLPARTRGVAASNLGILAAHCTDRAGASRLTDELEPFAEQLVRGATVRPCGAHVLGMLAALLGDPAAEQWFATAVRVHEAAGAVLLAAETRLEWARARVAAGDPSAARALADEAREAASRRRSSGIDGQARALLSSIDRRTGRPTRFMDTGGEANQAGSGSSG